MTYYARTDPHDPPRLLHDPEARWQKLRNHLVHVAWLARRFAREAAPGDAGFAPSAQWAGLLHDLGKYQAEFQERLIHLAEGRPARKAPHSPYGAACAEQAKALELSLAILGHHAGLPAASDLKRRLGQIDPERVHRLLALQIEDFRAFGSLLAEGPTKTKVGRDGLLQLELGIRMLLSCLVDADRLDAERHKTGRLPRGATQPG